MARISPGTHTELRNQTTDLSERAQNILLYKERDSVLAQNDTASFHLDAALKKLLLVYHASFSSARKKNSPLESLRGRGVSLAGVLRGCYVAWGVSSWNAGADCPGAGRWQRSRHCSRAN